MLPIIGIILIGFSWMLPNSSRPWTSFWQESTAFLGLIFILIFSMRKNSIKISKIYLLFLFILFFVLFIDFCMRDEKYFGDYIIGVFYFLSFSYSYSFFAGNNNKEIVNNFFMSLLICAIFSNGIAVAQWLQIDLNRVYFLEHPLGSRSFANIGQANHFGTLMTWGVICAYYLESQRKISMHSTIFIVFFLIFGLCLSQSRTAWLQIILCFVILSYFKFSRKINISILKFSIAPLFIVFLTWAISIISNSLNLRLERDIEEMTAKGNRIEHWKSMLDAIQNNPWMGYGWLHSAKAQIMGTNASGVESIFQYSHNIVIDTILWFGIPAALAIFVIFFFVILGISKRLKTPSQVYAYCAFIAFLVHSLLEYPFAYLYLLIPAGIFLGISSSMSDEFNLIKIPNKIYWLGIFLLSVTALLSLSDYWKIEAASTLLRLQYNGIGSNLPPPENPKIFILDQASFLMDSSYKKPSPDINLKNAQELSIAADRFGTQRILFHNAIAYAFIGDEIRSKRYLYDICRINSVHICKNTKIQWNEWQSLYPETIGDVEFPVVEKLN